jgi:hypothetical protein
LVSIPFPVTDQNPDPDTIELVFSLKNFQKTSLFLRMLSSHFYFFDFCIPFHFLLDPDPNPGQEPECITVLVLKKAVLIAVPFHNTDCNQSFGSGYGTKKNVNTAGQLSNFFASFFVHTGTKESYVKRSCRFD